MPDDADRLVFLHGFTQTHHHWHRCALLIAAACGDPTVRLVDLPGHGKSSGAGCDDTRAYAEAVIGLMDALGVDRAILVGNSAGGTVATMTALTYPERVQALVLVDAAIYTGGGTPPLLRPLFNTPQMQRIGPLIVRGIRDWGLEFGLSAWHDPEKIPPEFWDGYQKPLQAENWDRALWLLTSSSRQLDLEERLDELTLPTLVITGDDDRIVPTEQSIRLGEALPNADLVVLEACGHVPQEECPEPWLDAVVTFLRGL